MKEVLGIKTYNLKETAEILGLSTRTILTYIYDKKLKAVKIGAGWQITEDNIKAFVNSSGMDTKEE